MQGPVEFTPHFQICFPMCLYKKHVLEGGALWNLPTPPLFLFPFSFVTMKVHIQDENFLTPAFSPHIDPFQFVLGKTNRCWGLWTFLYLFGPFV